MRLLIAACLALPAMLPAAEQISHDYIEAQGIYLDPDDIDAEPGLRLRGSVRVAGNVLLVGDHTRASFETGGTDVDADISTLGVGYRMPVSELSDVSFLAGVLHARVDGGLIDDDRTGGLVAMEVRSRFNDTVELGTRAGWAYDGPEGSGYMLAMNALFHLNDWFAFSVEALTYELDVNHFGAGVRVSF